MDPDRSLSASTSATAGRIVPIGGHHRSRSSIGPLFTPGQRGDKVLGKRPANDAGLEGEAVVLQELGIEAYWLLTATC